MRNLIALGLIVLCGAVWSQEWEDRKLFNADGATANLRIISSTDTDLFAPLVDAFVATAPMSDGSPHQASAHTHRS